MKRLTYAIASTVIALTIAGHGVANAQSGPFSVSVMGSYIDDDEDRAVDDGVHGGQLSLGYALNDAFNLEGQLSFASHDVAGNGQDHLGFGLDLQRIFRRDERFSPYLHAGVGYMAVNPDTGPEDDGAMYSAGAGFLMKLFQSNVALRAEYRYRYDTADDALEFSDNIVSLGLTIPFGSGASGIGDGDGDGVSDRFDRCPNTPPVTFVDSYGCELDSDGDGVKDSRDSCRDTPAGTPVDDSGCPMEAVAETDGDGDGVSDDDDRCPNTRVGASVDADGCELDSDKDGVVDRLDQCPGTAAGLQVDISGCEIKGEIRLPGVNFETNSDRLLSGATYVLADAAATLKKNPTIVVEVAGHTDSDGSADYNAGLSSRRAATVRDYLAANGVADNRMSVRGYGESQPIADNTTAAGKAQNRRVVLRILQR